MIQQKNLIILNYTQIFTLFSVPFIHFSQIKGNIDHKKRESCRYVAKICNIPVTLYTSNDSVLFMQSFRTVIQADSD